MKDKQQHVVSSLEESLQKNIIDLVNYHLSGGSLQIATDEAGDIAPVIKAGLYGEETRRYRQELGGVITNFEQLVNIPGMDNVVLEELAWVATRLNQDKLKALAPQTTWNNEVTPYVNGPQCLEMLKLELQGVPESILFLQDKVQEDVEITGLNVIDHRKFILIDGITSIVGSLNIGDQYTYETPINSSTTAQIDGHPLGIPEKEEEWHDGCFRIRGAVAKPLNSVFHSRWLLLGGDHFNVEDGYYAPDTDLTFGEEECTLFVSFPGNPVNLIQQYY